MWEFKFPFFYLKKKKNFSRFLGIFTVFSSKQMPQKDIGIGADTQRKEKDRDKKERSRRMKKQTSKKQRLGKTYLLAQECHFLQPALCAGRGINFCQN